MLDAGSPSLPRLVIAAPQGRSGKTTVALGICAALVARGQIVQPFKKGPDYIDPSWLSAAAGRPCRSLDPFFLASPEEVRRAFANGSSGADMGIIEGNHGLYDSLDEDGNGSTAALARVLSAPVILVVNAARMSRSVAAMVRGYQAFEPDTQIAAVILNNVAQGRHERKLKAALERYCSIPVVGTLPRDEAVIIPDRHLGLVPRAEGDFIPALEACQRSAERFIDLEAVLQIARSAPSLQAAPSTVTVCRPSSPAVVIGVIRDLAFSFYYPENLEALEQAGAQLVFIDALQDASLPEVDALYIGGGFPEVFMRELSANGALKGQIRAAVHVGLPVYAECGGLMYLSRRLIWGDHSAEMVGVLPCEVEMHDRPQGHGYVIAETDSNNPFFAPGVQLRGHEFHHSRLVRLNGELSTAYHLLRGSGLGARRDGIVYRNVLASYTHLHADGSPGWAEGLVAKAKAYAKEVRNGRKGTKGRKVRRKVRKDADVCAKRDYG